MNRAFYVMGKMLTNLYRRPLASLGTFLSLTLLYLLLNLAWTASLSTGAYYARMISQIEVEAFLDDSVPDSTIALFVESLSKLDGVQTVVFVSKDEARARLTSLMGLDLMDGFEENPLPRSLVISFKENYLTSRSLEAFRNQLFNLQGVTEIFYAQRWLEKAEEARRLIGKIVLFLSIVIIIAVILNLIQSVRFSARNDRDEIAQIKLMGGGISLTSLPYVLEGLLLSLLSGIASWMLIHYSLGYVSIREVTIIYPASSEQYLFYLGAAALGLLAGFMGTVWKK
ncbi:MAG: permease-like cell division protein FtsX [Candidatus Zixiibacteriota bacterium]|jgi:cell division transport system permease protein